MSEYQIKRENFKIETLKHFEFLVEEFGYDKPNYAEYKQPNGVVISDTFEFRNHVSNKTIRIENHYHPVDYGFEFKLWNSLTEINHSNGQMLESYLKENQNAEQTYIQKVAELVRERHKNIIS